MPTLKEYVVLSAAVYQDARGSKNVNPLPPNWSPIDKVSNATGGIGGFVATGLTAEAFKNGNDIVIAFKGTDFLVGTNNWQTANDLGADITLGLGFGSSQIRLAALFYQRVKAANPGANISFTGHSLGAGLASVMSVWFNRPANIFADAPFELTALNPVLMGLVASSLALNGYSDQEFTNFFPINPSIYAVRETNVISHYVQGEVLNKILGWAPFVVGQNIPIEIGGGDFDSVGLTLHSIVLHAALLLDDKFRTDTLALPSLLKSIFDESLYAAPQQSRKQDFLSKLLNAQIPLMNGDMASGLLARFGVDVEKLTKEGVIHDSGINKALIAYAIENYYFKKTADTKSAFTTSTGSLNFKYSDINVDSYKSLSLLVAAIKNSLSISEKSYADQLIKQDAWHIQQGTSAMNWTADSSTQNDAAIGGVGVDVMDGGAGEDILIGGAGGDVLTGGEGNDILLGGLDNDFYLFEGNFGKDKIIDSDGLGIIKIDGSVVGTAKGSGQRNHWKADLGGGQFAEMVLYDDSASSTGKRLVITKGTDTNNTITINNFDLIKAQSATGYLGIKLDATVKLALVKGTGTNLFTDINFDPSSLASANANVPEGTGTSFTIFFNKAAKKGDTITLTMGGTFKAFIGGASVNANGAVITLTEGQTEATFGLVEDGEVNADATLQLSASFSGVAGTATSNVFGINLKDGGAIVKTFTGDQRPVINRIGTFEWSPNKLPDGTLVGGITYLPDGTMVGGVAEDGFSDTIEADSPSPQKIDGKGGNDVLGGTSGYVEIYGGDGDDLIAGGDGHGRLFGGNGNDFIDSADNINATLKPISPQATLFGRDPLGYAGLWGDTQPADLRIITKGLTWFIGERGDANLGTAYRVIYGLGNPMHYARSTNSDFVDGGAGNDTIIASNGNDYVIGGSGEDNIRGVAGNDVLYGGDDKDYIDGDANLAVDDIGYEFGVPLCTYAEHGDDFIDGGAGDDTLLGHGGNDSIYGGTGDDIMSGDTFDTMGGKYFLPTNYHGNDYLDGEDGDDNMQGGGKDDTLYGGAGKDKMWGDTSSKADVGVIVGNDYLDGEEGDDQLVGGAKDDTLYGGDGSDLLWGDVAEAGMDGALNGKDYLDGGKGKDQLIGGGNDDILYGGEGDDTLIGDDDLSIVAEQYQGADYLDGGSGDDELDGGGGNDTLIGGDGNDLLDGGTGADYMEGGAGNDTYIVDSEDDVIVEIDNPTPPALSERANLVLDAGAESTDAVGFNGLANTPISSNISPNISSNISPNTLQSFDASAGDVNNVQARISYTLGAHLNNVVLVGTAAINGTGNDLNNELIGNGAANILDGGAGNDFIDGGAGIDTMIGGSGDDIYNVDDIADVVQEAADLTGNNVYLFQRREALLNPHWHTPSTQSPCTLQARAA